MIIPLLPNTEFPYHKATEFATEGLQLSFITFFLTIGLELWSIETVRKVLKQKGAGQSLYSSGVAANLRNHFIFGWTIYTVAGLAFCRENGELDVMERCNCVFVLLFVHSLFFYAAHRLFHTYPSLYRHHKFHHRFNIHVPPMAANAVSSVEYIVAYILPFTVAMPLMRPDPVSLRLSVAIVSFTNLLVHTPKLESLSSQIMPDWLVSTEDHLEHHRKLNTKYAAPTFNIDYFVGFVEGAPRSKKMK